MTSQDETGGVAAAGVGAAPIENTAATETLYPLQFDGKGGEYFRIWIVNVALTVLTFGIYSAWATVRTRRYFYGKTSLDGTPFQFTAKPIPILIGRIIAFIIFGAYSLLGQFQPLYALAFLFFVIFPLMPWMIVKSQQFRARYTQWRNIPFRFTGTYGQAFITYILLPVAAAFTLWIIIPIYWKSSAKFQFNNLHYGSTDFAFDDDTKGFWSTLGLAVLSFIGLGIVATIIGFVASQGLGSSVGESAIIFGVAAFYFAMIFVFILVQARLFNVSLGGATAGPIRLRPSLPVMGWGWVILSNLVLVLITFGIAYPWTAVRAARYKINHMAVATTEPLDFDAFADRSDVGATGAEMASDFGFEISLF